jgi:tol-pal system protein YbgF
MLREGGLARMSGCVPNMRLGGRAAGAWRARCVLAAISVIAGCAHRAPEPARADPEIARLRSALAERDRTIEHLEGRLALRQAPPVEPPVAHTSGGALPARGPVPAPEEAPRIEAPAHISNEPRPLLRLHEDRHGGSVSWTPPATTELLRVAPLPSLSPPPSHDAGAEDLYVRALDLVRRREFAEALRELDAFLARYPGDARALRAQFWRGEVLFAQHEYGHALAAYEQVLAREPRGEKVPDVLLRLARCSLRVGTPERARALLEQLETEYPDSEAARLARRGKQEDG